MPRKISPCWKITWVGVGRGAREVATDNWSNWKSFQLLNFILLMSENQKNILLVEDNPINQKIVILGLKKYVKNILSNIYLLILKSRMVLKSQLNFQKSLAYIDRIIVVAFIL